MVRVMLLFRGTVKSFKKYEIYQWFHSVEILLFCWNKYNWIIFFLHVNMSKTFISARMVLSLLLASSVWNQTNYSLKWMNFAYQDSKYYLKHCKNVFTRWICINSLERQTWMKLFCWQCYRQVLIRRTL